MRELWMTLPYLAYLVPVYISDHIADAGHCDISKREIYINKEVPPENRVSVLLHEMVHLIAELHEISLTEQEVLIFEYGLFQMLGNVLIDSLVDMSSIEESPFGL